MKSHPFEEIRSRAKVSHVIVGELPYYRSSPDRWEPIIVQMKSAGIDVISFYMPWRFHEVVIGEFDFRGVSNPQKDVIRFLHLIKEAGLGVLIKPGPFIHAEVQLGGLPDRLCDEKYVRSYVGKEQRKLLSQGKPLPSVHDPIFRREADVWLKAVTREVIGPFAAPCGPIIAVQIGNEGVVGEACKPVTSTDLSGRVDSGTSQELGVAQASAAVIVQQWDLIASHLPSNLAHVVNVPLVHMGIVAEETAFGSWLARMYAFKATNYYIGHTEWVGDASSNPSAFLAHVIQITAGESDQIEGNWGFTWSSDRFANGSSPLFHALLALMLGSRLLSVYTACATETWDAVIDLDPQGVIADGSDPRLYDPPYCPGAPFNENGSTNVNVAALRALAVFRAAYGSLFVVTELKLDLEILVDPTSINTAAVDGAESDALNQLAELIGKSLLDDQVHAAIRLSGNSGGSTVRWSTAEDTAKIAVLARDLRQRHFASLHSRTACLRRSGEGIEVLGLFNPFDQKDFVTINMQEVAVRIAIKPHTAVIAKIENGELHILFSSTDIFLDCHDISREMSL